MSSTYDGIDFETELQAKWAAFFDLVGWVWKKNPAPVANWKPDFRVTFDCGHSECGGSHTVLVSVLPLDDTEGVKGHPALMHVYSVKDSRGNYIADAGAIFGSSPSATRWEMAHGAGGGIENVTKWVIDANSLWNQAASRVSSGS